MRIADCGMQNRRPSASGIPPSALRAPHWIDALRAPREDRGILIEPPLSAVGQLLATNEDCRQAFDGYDAQGRSMAELAAQARREFVEQAVHYTSAYRDVAACRTDRILLAGHQPELFHPGVWFKNFVLSGLAQRHAAVGINLVIDSDCIRGASLRVPGGTVHEPAVESVLFDAAGPEIPYEERPILDRALFRSFAGRVVEPIAPLVPDPLIIQLWPLVVDRAEATGSLGTCLAQGRHRLEAAWGLQTLELPQSRVCQLEAFYWFLAHLLAQLPRLREVYNAAVADYRRQRRIRSASHPVPDLAREDDWLEAPFWIWQTGEPVRRRLFVRRLPGELVLTDRAGLCIDLPLAADGDASRAVDVLRNLPDRGIKLRTRALLTTLWARLCLGDLFLHGIGGAKYDQLTDAILREFFGLQPPEYMAVSATLLLPIQRPRVSAEDLRSAEQRLRELTFQPERFISRNCEPQGSSREASPARPPSQALPSGSWFNECLPGGAADANALIQEKRSAIAEPPTRETAKRRCHRIRRANEALQPWVEPLRNELLAETASLQHRLRSEKLLASREYSFCLYPEQALRELRAQASPQ
jgi:hypothetical protein